MKKSILLAVLSFYAFVLSAQPATSLLAGKVVSDDLLPLQGATVKVVDSRSLAITNEKGAFSVRVQGASVILAVSYTGYQTRHVAVKLPADTLVIRLKESVRQLQDVTVSTGYEHLPRERATGSFEKIDQSLLNRQISTDFLSRLDGLAAGLMLTRPSDGTGSSNRFSIRGLSTLTSTSSMDRPLIVLDNFPFEGDINNINPNDIESVTLLKDAAASSIWGVRAGNGVLVITTRRAKYGEPFKLNFRSNLTVTDRPDLFASPQISSSDYIDMETQLFNSGYFNSDLTNIRNRPVVSPVVELLGRVRAGSLDSLQAARQIDQYRGIELRRDVSRYLYRKALNQQYALSFQGGSPTASYLVSAGYDRNLRSLAENSYDRLTLKSTATYKPVKRLTLETGITYSSSKEVLNNPGTAVLNSNRALYPYARLADENGVPLVVDKDYRASYTDTAGKGRLLDWKFRPLQEIRDADNSTPVRNLILNAAARYQVSGWLGAELRYQYQNQETSGRSFYSPDTYYTRNLVNRYSQLKGTSLTTIIPAKGILDYSDADLSSHNVRGQLNVNKVWNSLHEVSAIGGAELRETNNDLSSGRYYGYDDDILSSDAVDYTGLYPIYGDLASNARVPYVYAANASLSRFLSFYTNASYSYKRRYTATFSARRDASNVFGVKTNQRWNPLWSAGAAWNLSDEPFYSFDLIPSLKLRATYGYSGNINPGLSGLSVINYQSYKSFINQLTYALVRNPRNESLRWEKVTTVNLGIDFQTKGSVLKGSVEYYRKTSTDLFGMVPADKTTGFSSFTLNSAELMTKGVDVTLTSENLRGKLNWSSHYIFSYNSNKVDKYLYEYTQPSDIVGSGGILTPLPGYSAYSVVSYRWAGLDQKGDPQGFLEGTPSTDYAKIIQQSKLADFIYHGPAVPVYIGGFRNDFSWRTFSLSANITYRLGYYFRKPTLNYSAFISSGAVPHADYYLRWQQPGDELITDVPAYRYPANTRRDQFFRDSEVNVGKGDHIRLQDINLSYSPSFTGWKHKPFRELRLTCYANNIGLIWRANKWGIDPEYPVMPAPFSLSFGLNVGI